MAASWPWFLAVAVADGGVVGSVDVWEDAGEGACLSRELVRRDAGPVQQVELVPRLLGALGGVGQLEIDGDGAGVGFVAAVGVVVDALVVAADVELLAGELLAGEDRLGLRVAVDAQEMEPVRWLGHDPRGRPRQTTGAGDGRHGWSPR